MTTSKRHPPARGRETGGFAIGLIVGLLIGLALALGVALYVAKVPSPFVNKVPQRTADQDAAEAEKNRHWDPNTPLYGKNPARPNSAAASGVVAAPFAGPPSSAPGVAGAGASAASSVARGASSARDPAAILADRPSARASSPAGDAGLAASTRSGTADPFSYFLQVGAYSRAEDAEEQRARVTLMGFAAKVYEREQSGRTVFRVRVGPYEKKEDADLAKDKLDGAAVESALVRVQK